MNDWQRTHDWGTLTRQEIGAARDAGALPVLTVGSCEQHADHLPVDTDTVSAHRVALLAAERCMAPHVLVLPPPSFGFSPHHLAWPGTVSLSLPTFLGLVGDVADSLHRTGFDRLLIVNGHGGNIGPLASACTALVSHAAPAASASSARISAATTAEANQTPIAPTSHASRTAIDPRLPMRCLRYELCCRHQGVPSRVGAPPGGARTRGLARIRPRHRGTTSHGQRDPHPSCRR